MRKNNTRGILINFSILLITIFLMTTLLSWVASGFNGLVDWFTYLGFSILSMVVVGLGWFLLTRSESLPSWLLALTIGAIAFRLGAGIIWYTVLPQYGYSTASELNGYVMSDAYKRDTAAWELGSSEKRLLAAYGGRYRSADQYGGMLLMSAGLYRLFNHLFGTGFHPRLGMVLVTAAFSGLAIPLIWAFSRRGWNSGWNTHPKQKSGDSGENDIVAIQKGNFGLTVASFSAWFLALYPEAVLQGSTQMREGFLITLIAGAFYGLAYYHKKHRKLGLVWVLVSILLAAFLSPPTAGLLLLALVVTVLIWGGILDNRFFRQPWFWVGIALLFLLIIAGSFYTLERLTTQSFNNPFEMLSWWFQKTAAYQAHLSERASGWIQKIFRNTPEWTHSPMLMVYGVSQPFLPAAVIDVTGAPVWRVTAIWRSAGWFLLLPLLIYAPFRAFTRKSRDRLSMSLSIIAWIVILLAAFRAGADPWDNVRYRAAFASLQIALASWAWISYRYAPDAWLKRAVILVLSILAWFVPWYLRRYIYLEWRIVDPFLTLALGLLTAAIVILIDWLISRRLRKQRS